MKLLRLVETPTASDGPVAVQCWTGESWRRVATDADFARAFRAADEAEVESGAAPLESSLSPGEEDHSSELNDAIALEFEAETRAVMLLPGSWVWSGLEVIPRAARRQNNAIGYMVEDQLAEDVEDLHFSCHPVQGDLCSVMAISQRKIAALHAQICRLGWPVTIAVPEYRLLGLYPQRSSVWFDDQRVHLWQAAGRGLTVNRGLLLPVAESLFAPGDPEQEEAEVESGPGILVLGQPKDLETGALTQLGSLEALPGSPEARMLAEFSPTAVGNLLTGEYQVALETADGPWWRKPAIAVAACFVVQLLFFVGAGTYYKIQANRADTHARSLFSDIFPGDTPRADLRRQITGYLNQSTGGSGDFARQLQQLAKVWSTGKSGDLRLQSLRFDGNRGELVLQLRAANLGQLDAIVGKLSNGEFRAELLAANELEEGVSGRIRLR